MDSIAKENLFMSVKRMISIIRYENLFTVHISKLWCISLMSNIQNEQPWIVKAAISSCLQGIPYSFALFPMIFNCIFDSTIRDQKTIEFLTCSAIVSSEFSHHALHELEIATIAMKTTFETIMCMSFLLLLHSIKSNPKQQEEAQPSAVEKEICAIFLVCLGKIHMSPYLMSSLLLILPSFFDELNRRFNLVFETILGDVKDLLYKLIVFPDFNVSSSTSQSTDMTANTEQTPAQLLSSNSTYNQSISFIAQLANDSYLYIIQSFKNLIKFCVKLYWAAHKNRIIQRSAIEILHFCRKINSQYMTKPTFTFLYNEYDKIIDRAICSCFSYPRTSQIMDNFSIENDVSHCLSFNDKHIYSFINFDNGKSIIYSSLPNNSSIYETINQSNNSKKSTSSIKETFMPLSGITLFMDAIAESLHEPNSFNHPKSKTKFNSQFPSNFKPQFHIRLIYFTKEQSSGYSSKFLHFLKSLGIQQSSNSILATDFLYEAFFEFSATVRQVVAVVWVDDNSIMDSAISKLQKETQLPVFIIINPSKNGLFHTKVIFADLGINQSNQTEKGSRSFYYYDIPNEEQQRKYNIPAYSCFGPLIGSLFLPATLLPRLVRETAVNGCIYIENQKQILENAEANKKTKPVMFIPWGTGHFFL